MKSGYTVSDDDPGRQPEAGSDSIPEPGRSTEMQQLSGPGHGFDGPAAESLDVGLLGLVSRQHSKLIEILRQVSSAVQGGRYLDAVDRLALFRRVLLTHLLNETSQFVPLIAATSCPLGQPQEAVVARFHHDAAAIGREVVQLSRRCAQCGISDCNAREIIQALELLDESLCNRLASRLADLYLIYLSDEGS
jgi:hypothetical protein